METPHFSAISLVDKYCIVSSFLVQGSPQHPRYPQHFHLELFLNYDETLYTNYHIMYFYPLFLC